MPPSNVHMRNTTPQLLSEDIWTQIQRHMTAREWAQAAGTCRASWSVEPQDVAVYNDIPWQGEALKLRTYSILPSCCLLTCPLSHDPVNTTIAVHAKEDTQVNLGIHAYMPVTTTHLSFVWRAGYLFLLRHCKMAKSLLLRLESAQATSDLVRALRLVSSQNQVDQMKCPSISLTMYSSGEALAALSMACQSAQ